MLSHISKLHSDLSVGSARHKTWPVCVILLWLFCAQCFALEHESQLHNKPVSAETKNTIPGSIHIDLSTFHELRGEYKESETRLQLRSKMSGAYDVALSFTMGDLTLTGNFDLVNESMVLDGNNAILKPEHKKAFSHARQHLIKHLKREFQDEYPEHSFLAVQMLGYWSRAPKDHPIGRREIESKP